MTAIRLATAALLATTLGAAEPAKLTVHVDQNGPTISPTLYGIFFEEINRAGDGGIYGEMLENRSFEDNKDHPVCWTKVGTASMALDSAQPINPRNPTALKVNLENGGGVSNAGFKGVGLALRKGAAYRLSLYARAEGLEGPLMARLQSRDGKVLAEQPVKDLGAAWKKVELELTATDEDLAARLTLEAVGKGTLWLDMVSLFPKETWKGHGMRMDLAEMIAGMKPSFVRFPGGCYVEGDRLVDSVRWKESIGDPAERRGNWCIWGYRTTGGFGAHEFLQWCEDLDAEPLYVINCGMAHKDHVPMEQMKEYVQDALDLLEYARGPATSTWGAKRAANGHPAPFKLNYMEIGNENGGPIYHERYALFHDAIKAKYPDVKLVACVWGGVPKNRPLDIVDEHYYNTPQFFMQRAGMYDTYDRKGPKVYVGEYAVTNGCGKGNLIAALGEAAYMTGLEANADHVVMSSYAPLFTNPPWERWNPNAIHFDQARCFGTPSYHVQAMFANHRGDVVCPSEVTVAEETIAPPAGGIGIGTWKTKAEFKDIKVEKDGKVIFASDFSKDAKGWRFHRGQWRAVDGVLRQTGDEDNVRAYIGDPSWGGEYTLSLKARKLSGDEGFLVMFQAPNDDEKRWWNIAGWGNSRHALEGVGDEGSVDGRVEENRWYDIRIELKGTSITCFLDNQKVHAVTQKPLRPLYAVASRTADGKELILKVVNTSDQSFETALDLQGVKSVQAQAKAWTLTSGSTADENSFEQPRKAAPQESAASGLAAKCSYTFPARSVTVLRVGMER
jgi:alpha-L-arabinofuranosidase